MTSIIYSEESFPGTLHPGVKGRENKRSTRFCPQDHCPSLFVELPPPSSSLQHPTRTIGIHCLLNSPVFSSHSFIQLFTFQLCSISRELQALSFTAVHCLLKAFPVFSSFGLCPKQFNFKAIYDLLFFSCHSSFKAKHLIFP